MKISRFKSFLYESKRYKFQQDEYDSINRMYTAGEDDEKILGWIEKNIQSEIPANEIYNQFIKQKG